MEVHFADHLGLVAGRGERASQGVGRIPLGALETDDAIGGWGGAGHQATAGGDAAGALGVGLGAMEAGAGDIVEVGGLQDGGRARVEAEAVAALLVGDKQDDIGAGVGHGSASLGWRCAA